MNQHLEALRRGNAIRVAAARVRDSVRALPGDAAAIRVAEILRVDGTASAGSIWADELLTCVPRIGPARADRMLAAAGVVTRKRLRELTDRQRRCLADMLVGKAAA